MGRVATVAVGTIFMVACSSSRQNPSVLKDTTGATFAWSCPSSGCDVGVTTGTPPMPGDCAAGSNYGWFSGRLFSVCYFESLPNTAAAEIFVESCRPIVCSKDDDCPWMQLKNGMTYTCNNGLCESQANLENVDVEELCLSSDARPSTCDLTAVASGPDVQQALSEATASCPSGSDDGGVCNVPATCRQP